MSGKVFKIPYEQPENVYFLEGEDEEDICNRIMNHVLVSVGVPMDYGKENNIDWLANPTSNQYAEWTWQLGRHPEWKILAHQYRQNPKPEYAEAVAEMFQSWVSQAVFPGDVDGYQTMCWRTIECGIRMGASWPYTLFTFYNTKAFTDDILVDWYKSVWEHGSRLYHNRTSGNWLIMEMNGLAQIGIFYPQLKQSKEWLQSALESLYQELNKQIYPDGFQYELSTNYHNVVINNYQRLLQAAKIFDISVSDHVLRKLEKACEIYIQLMMPDGRIPNINDGCWTAAEELLGTKQSLFPDNQEIEWAASGKKKGVEPEYLSIAMPYSGFMVMRNGWGKNSTWALFDAAPFGTGHQHEDKLSMLLYANGKLLLTEGGNYAYDGSEMRKYVLSTRAHNTVRVDGKDQNRRKYYSWAVEDIQKRADLSWKIGTDYEYAESYYDEGYGEDALCNLTHHRKIYFVKNPGNGLEPFFIVVDRMKTTDTLEKHKYEVLWHIDNDLKQCTPSGCYFEDINVCISGNHREVSVVCGEEKPQMQGFVATGFEQGMYRPVNCVKSLFEGGDIRIVTVLYPKVQNIPQIIEVEAGESLEDNEILIKTSNGTQIIYNEKVLI